MKHSSPAVFSANVPRGSSEVARFVEVLHRCQALRRLGSAALNLCYVGTGRLDAYWASSVKIWDIAAGSLIVQEAGGVMTHLDGSPLNLEDPQFAAGRIAAVAFGTSGCVGPSFLAITMFVSEQL